MPQLFRPRFYLEPGTDHALKHEVFAKHRVGPKREMHPASKKLQICAFHITSACVGDINSGFSEGPDLLPACHFQRQEAAVG